MAAIMSDAWIAFTKTGRPSSELLPEWRPYTTPARYVMDLDVQSQLVSDPKVPVRTLTGAY